MTGVFIKFIYNKFSLVAMATSLEKLGNEFEIINHENTTIGQNKRLCYCRGTARRATSVEILWPFFD